MLRAALDGQDLRGEANPESAKITLDSAGYGTPSPPGAFGRRSLRLKASIDAVSGAQIFSEAPSGVPCSSPLPNPCKDGLAAKQGARGLFL